MELQNKKLTWKIMTVALMICLLACTCLLTSCGQSEPDVGRGQEESEHGQEVSKPGQEQSEVGQEHSEAGPESADHPAAEELENPTVSDIPDAIDMSDAPEGAPAEEDNYAQLELVPQVTIDPMATITALPMETVAEVDLDGDGVAEAVQVKAMKEGKDGKLYLSNLELPSIQIDMDYFSPEALYNSVNYYDENVDLASYFIFDLDLNDSCKEIGLYFDGPSGDPTTLLFRYKDGYLSKVGTFPSAVISDVCPSGVMWGREYMEPQEYREILETTKRDEIQVTVPGNGMVYAEGRFDLIETAWAGRSFRLDESSGKLIEVEQEDYVFAQYKREFPVTLKQEIEVCASILFEGEPITIPAGEKLTFKSYKPQGNWVEIGYGLKEEVGAEKGEFLFEHAGWIQVIEGKIVTPSGKYSAFDLFDNLNMAD